jgi:Protein of unknown function (DUF3574)
MNGSQIAAVAFAAFVLAACASTAGVSTACARGEAMVETQLFFGLSKPKGGSVSARQWEQFVANEITPRFPEGFSVIDGAGFWRDGTTQRTISEKSKVVVRLHGAAPEVDQAITAIIDAYKVRFAQEAVLRVDRSVCAQF